MFTPNRLLRRTSAPRASLIPVRHQRRIGLASIALLTVVTSAPAQTTITKADNVDPLSFATSWVEGIVPGAADVALWNNVVTGPNTVTLGGNLTWRGLKIANPAGPVTIDIGSILTLGTGGIDLVAATQDLALNATIRLASGDGFWNVAPGRTLTLAAIPIRNTATGGLGGGNNDSVGGSLRVATTGTVKIGSIALPIINDGSNNPFITYGLGDWAATDATGTVIAASYAASSAGVAAGTNVNVDSDFTVASLDITSLRFADATGPRTLTISGNNTFTARAILMTPDSLGATITGGNIRPSRSSTAGASFSIIQNSTVGDLTIASSIPNASSNTPVSVVKAGVGRVILTNNNGYTGRTFINAGTLQLGNGGTTGSVGATNTSPILNSGLLAINRSDNVSIANVISGSGAVTQIGPGELTLSGANTFTGAANLNGGTLNLSALSNLGSGSAINFNGGTLKFGAGVTEDLSVRAVTFGSGGATLHTNGNDVTFANALGNGGPGGLTKTGAGTLTLVAANSYDGPTNVSAGSLRVSNTAGSATGSGSVSLNAGGTLTGRGVIAGAVTMNSGSTLAPGTGVGSLSVGSLTVGAGAIFDYELNATPANDRVVVTTPGGLTINGGGFRLVNEGTATPFSTAGSYNLLSFSGVIGGAGPGALSVLNPAPGFSYTFGTGGSAVTLTISLSGLLTSWSSPSGGSWGDAGKWNNGVPNGAQATATFGTAITVPGTVTLDGNKTVGALSFENANTYTIAAGASGSLTLQSDSAPVLLNVLTGSHVITAPVVLGTDLKLDTSTGSALRIPGSVSGARSLTKVGAGKLTLPGTNSYSGGTAIKAGVLEFSNLGSLGTGDLTLGGGMLQWATGNTEDISVRTVTLGSGGGGFDTSGNNVTLANAIGNTGTGGLTKTGAGTLTLGGFNTFTGPTAVTGGTLSISGNGNLGDEVAAAGITLDGGTLAITSLLSFGSAGLNARAVTVGNAGATIEVAEFASAAVPGIVSGSGALRKTGLGTLQLAGNNSITFSGSVTLSGGVLELAGGEVNDQLGIGPGALVFNGGTLTMNGHLGSATPGYGTLGNAISVPAGQTGTLNLTQRGALTSTLTGEGTLNLRVNFVRGDVSTNWSAFTGTINVLSTNAADGNDDFRISGFVPLNIPSAKLALGEGVTLYQNFNPPSGATPETVHNIGELSGAATSFILGNPVPGRFANWTIGALNTDSSFAGIIQDTATTTTPGQARLTKTGLGTLTLSGVNTYTGETTINAGTLLVTGSIAGTTTTINSGRLQGTGATGSVIVNSAGTLEVGPGIESLDIDGSLTLNSTATLALKINTSTIAADVVNVTGFFNPDFANLATLSLTDAGSNLPLPVGTSFMLVDYADGGWNGYFFDGRSDDSTFVLGANEFRISYDGLDGATSAVTLQAVPEAGVAVTGLAAFGCLAGLRRFRRVK